MTRLERATMIAERNEITRAGNTFYVPSASSELVYKVTLDGGRITCTCEDFKRRQQPCQHCLAAGLVALEESK